MQERYLGDVHDFLKYAFLRHLARSTNFRIGLNWCLNRPEDVDPKRTNDGEKRFHLTGRDKLQWQQWDPELFKKLISFSDKSRRRLYNFHNLKILDAKTVYFEKHVPVLKSERDNWHNEALGAFEKCDFVFLDPDNGFKVKSATGKKAAKYMEYAQVAEYFAAGKAIVSIQFARQCDPVKKANEVRENIGSLIKPTNILPIIRGRVSPNILFIPIAPSSKKKELKRVVESFAQLSPPMGKDGNRAELV